MDFDNDTDTITPNTNNGVLTIGGTGALVIPGGSTASAPPLVNGMMRYDTDTGKVLIQQGGTTFNAGTVTTVSVTTANGVSGSVATNTTTPAITLTLGAITPTSVNSVVISGSATPTLSVTGTSSISGSHSGTSSGTNTGDQTITLTGNVTGSGTGSFATTIASNVVTNAMQATVATATFKGRTTAGTGNVEDLTATQATALLNVFGADAGAGGVKGLVPATVSGDAAKYLKGDGTWSSIGGGGTVTSVSVVSANGFAGTVATASTTPAITITTSITGILKGNGTAISAATAGTDYLAPTGSGAALTGITVSQVSGAEATANKDATGGYVGMTLFKHNFKNAANTFTSFLTNTNTAARTYTFQDRDGTIADNTDLGAKVSAITVTTANGVSGAIGGTTTNPTITLTLGAITPTSVNSVVLSGSATPTLAVTGTSSISGSHSGTSSGTNTGDQTITLTGNVTGSGTGSFATTIAANVVTNAMQATVATATFKGRTTAGTGNVEDLTATQATALLNVFGADSGAGGVKGLVPATVSGDSAKYLKGDGTWSAIAGGGTVTSVSVVSANGFAGTVATATTTPAITLTTSITGILKGNGTAISAVVSGTDIKTVNGTTLLGSGDLAVSASPAGSNQQIQYNNAGALGGAGNVLIDGSDLLLSINASPSTPSAGVKLFGREIAGRDMLAIVGPSGLDTALQPHTARNKVALWNAVGNAVTISLLGTGALTATGTATTANVATTNIYTYQKRVEYLVTTAATTAVAGWRYTSAQWTIGGTAAGLGGFHYITRWAPSTGVATATNRCFVGMASVTTAPTDVEPSTITNIIGLGWDSADTNIQIMYRAAGAINKIDLGASFPVPTVDRTKTYELALFSPPGTTQSVSYEVNELNTSNKATGTITTNLPTTTTLLAPRAWMSVGGTSSVIGIALISQYIESDL